MKAIRKYGTCFFEQYAQIALSALVSREFDTLVNKDRPDLQSKDGHSIGCGCRKDPPSPAARPGWCR